MSAGSVGLRNHITLALCTVLHAFTHAYGSLLVPLYLLMVRDLGLKGVGSASLIVTLYGIVYCLFSYGSGVLADRFNRKALLGIGLLGNALAIMAMGLTHRYELLIACGILAGLFGTLFHPAANALVPAHYPKSPGMAIGLLGIGSGVGFFAGPQFAGWRAQSAHWNLFGVSDWQRPCFEAGAAGFIIGVLFLLVAREVRPQKIGTGAVFHPVGQQLVRRVALIATILGCRDFAGIATLSLASIYLQKAHHLDAKRTGFILGAMMLVTIIINPIAVWLSPGRRRLPALALILVCGGIVLATTPLWPLSLVLPVLCLFQTFQLGSYAVSDAAILERVPANIRGRVVGIFLTIAGTFSSTSPFVMGFWTDKLGPRAYEVNAYLPIFGVLAAMMWTAAFATPLIAHIGPPVSTPIEPITETSPATLEPAV